MMDEMKVAAMAAEKAVLWAVLLVFALAVAMAGKLGISLVFGLAAKMGSHSAARKVGWRADERVAW